MTKKASGDALDRALTTLYQADVPTGFQAAWRDAVKREEPSQMKPSNPPFAWLRRAALPMAAALVLIAGTLITGSLSPQTESDQPPAGAYTAAMDEEAYDDGAYQMTNAAAKLGYERSADTVLMETSSDFAMAEDGAAAPSAAMGGATASTAAQAAEPRKIVRTVSLTLASTAFDQDYETILSLADGAGGYAGAVDLYSRETGKRSASFTLRIPAAGLDDFLRALEGIGRVTQRYETADDLTTQYADTRLRLQTQQDKLTRLEELLLQAEDVETLLLIESEIADTHYTIDSLESSLRLIDNQVDYATVSVFLAEQSPIDTAVATDLTIGERIANGLRATLAWLGGFFENMLIFLVAAAPVLLPLLAVFLIIRAVRKRRQTKKQS